MTQQKKEVLLLNALPCVLEGTLTHVDGDGSPHVIWAGQPQAVRAETQQPVTIHAIGQRCTLAFIGGELSRPVIMGWLYPTGAGSQSQAIIQTDDSLILQRGAARIELYANGRINIRGLHIDSQAYGPNRIKGAAVKIN